MKHFIDELLFQEAKSRMIARTKGEKGIGTLREKTVHSVLKYYFAPDESCHEQKIGSFVADICIDGEIYEIQTKQFYLMKRKLDCFLPDYDVTIIYPISVENTLHWIDGEEIHSSRKRKRRGAIYDFFQELYGIRSFIGHKRLRFILVLLSTEEYRLLDGYGSSRKRKATKTDKIPMAMLDMISLSDKSDYSVFLPDDLSEEFTSLDFSKSARISRPLAGTALLLLQELGVVERVGKQGNAYLYKKSLK